MTKNQEIDYIHVMFNRINDRNYIEKKLKEYKRRSKREGFENLFIKLHYDNGIWGTYQFLHYKKAEYLLREQRIKTLPILSDKERKKIKRQIKNFKPEK